MNSNALQVFSNSEFRIRTINDNGETWFVAKDIAEALEYSEASNPARLFANVPELWKGVKRIHTRSENGVEQERDILCLTEQGVYFFLGRSDKQKALPYQIWIAGDVVPSIRKAGSYNMNKPVITFDPMQSAKLIFEVAGIKENQLALALDKVHRSYTGQSALEAGEIVLTAPTPNQLLTPTDIGKHFGLKPHRVNEILAGAGYQHKIGGKWETLPLGEPYSIMQDVGKRHSNGTPVRQLKWTSNILQVFPSLQND